ncbi:hypothetical protein [Saccharothrix texasensis]|uniref:Uncharacterized protein n=1 Tax=Saccharothrix texasensis TaxID=103734 RepID=A0A3N1HH01_9PSEU|nr:hypothetical protein [Saccharothrix texasensis]ROP41602.1 hypothetical protein EDD40_7038 [Saccharothrix texasensis]
MPAQWHEVLFRQANTVSRARAALPIGVAAAFAVFVAFGATPRLFLPVWVSVVLLGVSVAALHWHVRGAPLRPNRLRGGATRLVVSWHGRSRGFAPRYLFHSS